MVDHLIIEPLSILWWKGLLSSFFSVTLLLFLLRNQSLKIKERFGKALAVVFILVYLITLITTLKNGTWNIQDHLPLHLCRISFIICVITLLSKTQWMYEWCLFLAIPAGFHSLLTPELTNGISNWFFFDYYFGIEYESNLEDRIDWISFHQIFYQRLNKQKNKKSELVMIEEVWDLSEPIIGILKRIGINYTDDLNNYNKFSFRNYE